MTRTRIDPLTPTAAVVTQKHPKIRLVDALLAAAASGDLGLVQAHAQRMRGALAQVDAARDAAELCRELEAGAAWAVQATQDRIGELGLILDACLPGYRHSRLSP